MNTPKPLYRTKWAGFLELEFATNDLTLWWWIRWVKTVLLEALRANVRSGGNWIGLKPSTIHSSALEASRETIIGTELTLQETTETRALPLVENQGSVPGLELSPFRFKTE